jgi:hypothetical protein
LELQIIWSTKIIGMEFSASKAMMRTALLNYYLLCLWSFFWVVKNSKNWLNISLICKKNYLQNSCFPQKRSPINWVRQSCDKFLGRAKVFPTSKRYCSLWVNPPGNPKIGAKILLRHANWVPSSPLPQY